MQEDAKVETTFKYCLELWPASLILSSVSYLQPLMLFHHVSMFFMLVKYYHEAYHYHGIIINQTNFSKTNFDKNSMILSEGIEVEYNGIGKVGINIILPNGQEGIISASNFRKL